MTMVVVTTAFGEVAGDYEDVRPDYPVSITASITDYLGRTPSLIAEIGAGTGKATALFARLAPALLCVEPDPRMAAHVRRKYPHAEVVTSDFASWTPPPGGVPVLAGALVWHLLDGKQRCAKAHSALRPDGVVAIIGRKYGCVSPEQRAALGEAFEAHGCPTRSRTTQWIHDELATSGLFTDVALSRHDTRQTLNGDRYLRLVTTLSPFRRLPGEQRQRLLDALRSAIGDTGGVVQMELETTLNLARRA